MNWTYPILQQEPSIAVRYSLSAIFVTIQQNILPRLSIRFDRSPIGTLPKLGHFVHTRSAYVAQTSLYGYLKTRMGTRFRDMFTDDEYVKSINIAKWRVFAACLSDLTIFVCALTAKDEHLSRDEIVAMAIEVYEFCVTETFDECEDASLANVVNTNFRERAEGVIWANAAIGENAFSKSPGELIIWAPIADELKRYDSKIVRNSIRFRWRDVRNQLRRRLDPDAIINQWRENHRVAPV